MADLERCTGFRFTPGTAPPLWTIAQVLVDQAFDNIRLYGLSR
ncbi:hypothetical protein ACLQ24_29225 [Micromonospora sp. DT4]